MVIIIVSSALQSTVSFIHHGAIEIDMLLIFLLVGILNNLPCKECLGPDHQIRHGTEIFQLAHPLLHRVT